LGESDVPRVDVLGKRAVPRGVPQGAVLRVGKEWRRWIGTVGGIFDADVSARIVGGGEKETRSAEDIVGAGEFLGVLWREYMVGQAVRVLARADGGWPLLSGRVGVEARH
jgi:hypothetical protein